MRGQFVEFRYKGWLLFAPILVTDINHSSDEILVVARKHTEVLLKAAEYLLAGCAAVYSLITGKEMPIPYLIYETPLDEPQLIEIHRCGGKD